MKPVEELATASAEPGYALKVAVVYEDYLTREWAGHLCDWVTRFVGQECVRYTWWRIEKLTQPAILPKAVTAATQADVILVSVNTQKELPLDLCVWIDIWLPRRQQQPGALVALIGRERGASTSDLQAYLEAVARRGGLDFLTREHEPLQLPAPFQEESALQQACNASQVLSAVLNGTSGTFCDWRISE